MNPSTTTHGTDNRGLAAGANPGVAFGRFGAMFDAPAAGQIPEAGLMALANAMIKKDAGSPITVDEPADENPAIPAGYTYFGQFIDHDITFDPTPLNAGIVDRNALVDFRSPALDLDNLYGRGPDDQPYMYEADGLRLRVGRETGAADAVVATRNDLFRLVDGTPLLGDKRNDENKIVSQFHGAMIAFHNKVVADDALLAQWGSDLSTPAARFRTAAQIVRWHYQWVVVFDYLRHVCLPGILTDVLNWGDTPRLQHYLKLGLQSAYMPIEFSGAAFRFGHSMVRPSYALNTLVTHAIDDEAGLNRIPTFGRDRTDDRHNLNGFPGPLAPQWGIDFGFFLDGVTPGAGVEATPPKDGAGGRPAMLVPQPSYRIDALLAEPLKDLPEFFKETSTPAGAASLVGHLAFRNLRRGQMLGLPSGQAVARLMGQVPLTDEVLWGVGSRLVDRAKLPGDTASDFDLTVKARSAFAGEWVKPKGAALSGNAPLWYYVLREAEYHGVLHRPRDPGIGFGGQHLGPVGSRIVCETLIGLLWMDPSSFLRSQRLFKPMARIASPDGTLTLGRLVTFALT